MQQPKKNVRAFLEDAINTIEEIEQVLVSKKLPDYSEPTIKWAAERSISIIGEALWRASKIHPDLPISSLKQIIGTRHILVHEYDMVDAARLYSIIHKYLPILKTEVQNILEEMNEGEA